MHHTCGLRQRFTECASGGQAASPHHLTARCLVQRRRMAHACAIEATTSPAYSTLQVGNPTVNGNAISHPPLVPGHSHIPLSFVRNCTTSRKKKPSPALGKRHNSFELSWPGWRDVPGSEDSPRSDSLAPLFPCKREKVSRLARGLCLLVSPEDWVRGRNKVIITALVVLYTFDIKSPK